MVLQLHLTITTCVWHVMTMPAHIPHPTLFAKQIVLSNTMWPKSDDAYMHPLWLLKVLKNRFAYQQVTLICVSCDVNLFFVAYLKHFLWLTLNIFCG